MTDRDQTSELARAYWDADAATYDLSHTHAPHSPVARVAWATAVEGALPTPPSRVLDVGAGTGFLSVPAARSGHAVTALDVSTAMLGVLERKAVDDGLSISVTAGDAQAVPEESFDAVMTRHLLWTLPDPGRALAGWRRATRAGGSLAAFDSMWGTDPVERARTAVMDAIRRVRGAGSDHHAPYPEELRSRLPFSTGLHPADLVGLVESSGWTGVRLRRLRDVEWAMSLDRSLPERILGSHPIYVLTATNPG